MVSSLVHAIGHRACAISMTVAGLLRLEVRLRFLIPMLRKCAHETKVMVVADSFAGPARARLSFWVMHCLTWWHNFVTRFGPNYDRSVRSTIFSLGGLFGGLSC